MTEAIAQSATGGCLCGAVRFAAEAYLRHAYYCHCTICQRTAGSPFMIGVPIKTGTLSFTKGAPAWYQSSPHGRRGFCAACGSPLLWAPLGSEKDWGTNVSVGALHNPADVRPRCHTYTDTRLPWLAIPDGLLHFTEPESVPEFQRWKAAWWR